MSRSQWLKFSLWLMPVCLLFMGVGVQQFSRAFWQQPKPEAAAVTFTIAEGESFAVIVQNLNAQALIANAFWFHVAGRFWGLTDNIQAGTYTLLPGDNYKKIFAILTAGKVADADTRVTIPEGYTLQQMEEVFVAKGLVTSQAWQQVTGADSPLENHEFIVAAQKPDDVDLEGYLFPDTYRFSAEATPEEIVTIMLENMAEHVNDVGIPRADAEGMSIHEVLSLASIVEREVRQPDTMKNVADIFLKRLEIGMPLQADSTVNYVTGGKDPSISFADRDNTDSPYNTYQHTGLPPGPISAPSMNALVAVIDPISNPYYYFLTSDDGQIYYAETNEEHAANKARYLR
jgi:UPF0755 protein